MIQEIISTTFGLGKILKENTLSRLAQGDWRVERDRSFTGHGKAQIRGSRASGPPRLSSHPGRLLKRDEG